MSRELGESGIRVNAILPSAVESARSVAFSGVGRRSAGAVSQKRTKCLMA
ncbi:hypothetical protein [Paraburkholderia caribensis]